MLTRASITTIKTPSSHTWCVQAPWGQLVWLQLTPHSFLLCCAQFQTLIYIPLSKGRHNSPSFHCLCAWLGARRGSWLPEASKKGVDWGNNIAQSICSQGPCHPNPLTKNLLIFWFWTNVTMTPAAGLKIPALLQGWFINMRYDICIKQQFISALLEAIYTRRYQIPKKCFEVQ